METDHRRIGVLLLASLLCLAGAGLAENAEQSGSGTTCADFNAFWAVTTFVESPLLVGQATDNIVQIEAGTDFEVQSPNGTVYVDFFQKTEDGYKWIGYNEGEQTGTVPSNADLATVCVGLAHDRWPDAPNPTAEWTYQDGF